MKIDYFNATGGLKKGERPMENTVSEWMELVEAILSREALIELLTVADRQSTPDFDIALHTLREIDDYLNIVDGITDPRFDLRDVRMKSLSTHTPIRSTEKKSAPELLPSEIGVELECMERAQLAIAEYFAETFPHLRAQYIACIQPRITSVAPDFLYQAIGMVMQDFSDALTRTAFEGGVLDGEDVDHVVTHYIGMLSTKIHLEILTERCGYELKPITEAMLAQRFRILGWKIRKRQ